LNFTDYSGQKNAVQTRKKMQFIKLDISNWKIAKIKCRLMGLMGWTRTKTLEKLKKQFMKLDTIKEVKTIHEIGDKKTK
jgi:hypothetical protein